MHPTPNGTRSGPDSGAAADLFSGRDPLLDWQDDRALCRQVDPEMFFPEVGPQPAPGAKSALGQFNEARRVCVVCPLIRDCLTYALSTDRNEFGVWGGTGHRWRQNARVRIAGDPRRLEAEVTAELERLDGRRAA